MSLRSRLKPAQEVDGILFHMTACTRFAVSQCGKVLGRMGRVLKHKTNGSYAIVAYQDDDGCIRNKYVHRLVAEVWVDNPHGHNVVNHTDGDKRNNHRTNLEWCTHQHNQRHAVATGLITNLPAKGQRGFQCRA